MRMSVVLLATAIVAAAASAAPAQQQQKAAGTRTATEVLGTAGVWSAYAARDATGRVCYLAGEPQKGEGAVAGRHQPIAMVTHRPAEQIANVVSFVEGYPLKPGSDVALDVDGRKFLLFVQGDSAWAQTSELDRAITTALSRGRIVVVRGEAANGRTTTDVYDLAGFAKALVLIDKACGLTPEQSVLPTPVVHQPPLPHRRVEALKKKAPVHRASVPKRPVNKRPVHKALAHKTTSHKPPAHQEKPSQVPSQEPPPHPSD